MPGQCDQYASLVVRVGRRRDMAFAYHYPAPVKAVLGHADGTLEQASAPFMGLFPMGGGRFRLIASNPLSKPGKATEPSLDELQSIYDGRSHIPARFHDMTWSSWFRINSRMVPRLKIGRLLLGGDAAHIHSPAGAQGMNTGIQDMMNLDWKLALVVQGKAPPALLDTYEQDRLPVMRDVLFKTEKLTGLIGSESPIVRSLMNHLGPWIGDSDLVQDNSTARMSQIALGYRDSTLSSNHAHVGNLLAGDRIPDLAVRHRTAAGWADGWLHGLVDPSRFVLLVAQDTEAHTLDPKLRDAASACGALITVVQLAPPEAAPQQRVYEAALGRRSSVFLIRPDGYAGLTAGANSAVHQLAAYYKQWLASEETAHAS